MRCPHCDLDNPDDRALCMNCDSPLTAYAAQGTGEVSEATRAKLARISSQPAIVPAVITLDVLLALFGPFAAVLGKFAARTVTNSEGTNYAGAAFGAVGIAFTALLMVPLGLFLLYIAWITWARGSWAWQANSVVLCGTAILSLTGFLGFAMFVRIVLAAACAIAAYLWFQPDAREWYGA